MFNYKKIDLFSKNEKTFYEIESPRPSKLYIPDWIKKSPSDILFEEKKHRTFKHCMPFIDSFVSGYIQELACDVEIIYNGKDFKNNDILTYKWAGDHRPISTRKEDEGSPNMLPKINGYYNFEMHWYSYWEPKTPPGYSTLYFHPLNRPDLPFYTFSGIIDTDKWFGTGPVPFLIKNGFEGLIPAGTPIYQFIFIKREYWKINQKKYILKNKNNMLYKLKKHFVDGYKKEFWTKKYYE